MFPQSTIRCATAARPLDAVRGRINLCLHRVNDASYIHIFLSVLPVLDIYITSDAMSD